MTSIGESTSSLTWQNALLAVKYFVSTVLVLYSVSLTIYGISAEYNIINFGSVLAEFLMLLFALLLLAANEGFQVAALGIHPMTVEEIEGRGFIRAAACHKLLYKNGSKIKRLLIGQSFFVVKNKRIPPSSLYTITGNIYCKILLNFPVGAVYIYHCSIDDICIFSGLWIASRLFKYFRYRRFAWYNIVYHMRAIITFHSRAAISLGGKLRYFNMCNCSAIN
jgi:hypothetical protein